MALIGNIVKLLKKSGLTGRLRQITLDSDYVAVKGVSLEGDPETYIDKSLDNQVQFTDQTSGTKKVSDLLDAEQENFDPLTSGLVSTLTGPAIRELASTVGVSASPGFGFGRASNVNTGTWLQTTGGVPSNKAGITVALTNPVIAEVFIASETISTFDITVYEHEGNEINLTSLGTVSVVSARSASFTVSYPVTSGRQLAIQLTSGSARNLNVGLQLQGSV